MYPTQKSHGHVIVDLKPNDREQRIPPPHPEANMVDNSEIALDTQRRIQNLHWSTKDAEQAKYLWDLAQDEGANAYDEETETLRGPVLVAVPIPKTEECFVILIDLLNMTKDPGKSNAWTQNQPLSQHLVSVVMPPLSQNTEGHSRFDARRPPIFLAIKSPLYLAAMLPGKDVKNSAVRNSRWALPQEDGSWQRLVTLLGLKAESLSSEIYSRMRFQEEPMVRCQLAINISTDNLYSPNKKENRAKREAAKAAEDAMDLDNSQEEASSSRSSARSSSPKRKSSNSGKKGSKTKSKSKSSSKDKKKHNKKSKSSKSKSSSKDKKRGRSEKRKEPKQKNLSRAEKEKQRRSIDAKEVAVQRLLADLTRKREANRLQNAGVLLAAQ